MRADAPRALLALIAFGDTVKPGARDAIAALSARGVASVLVTGDNRGSAAAVAASLGIGEVHAQVLPDDKARVVAELKRTHGGIVAMVGDGINDAPRSQRPTSVSRWRPAPTSRCIRPASR